MCSIRQIFLVVRSSFRRWRKNPQIILVFVIGFILCFLLSDKVVQFVDKHDSLLQTTEPFIWTFGDAKSVLIISLLLLLLFSNMPNLDNSVPFMLIRMKRNTWMLGQILYLIAATIVFVSFILLSTMVLCGKNAYPGNMWSETAAILGYSDIGSKISIPSFVKVMEFNSPYQCTFHIYGLMLGYSLLMASIMLFFNLISENGGTIAGIVFSVLGGVLNPELIAEWFHIPMQRMVEANIVFGWLSPLNHATYYMHNFGYDNLPRLWMSYLFFAVGSLLMFGLSMYRIRKYTFVFTG